MTINFIKSKKEMSSVLRLWTFQCLDSLFARTFKFTVTLSAIKNFRELRFIQRAKQI